MEIQTILNFTLKLESKVMNISLIILFLTMFHASGPWFYYMVHIVDVIFTQASVQLIELFVLIFIYFVGGGGGVHLYWD